MKIKKGDQAQIITGKDRGKRGNVLRTMPSERRIIIEGLNLVKRHRRPRRSGEKGQRVEVPAPIDISNAMLICPHCGKPTRVGYKITGNSKHRVCKKCKVEI
jgi:large subunit ribosomal protein L24